MSNTHVKRSRAASKTTLAIFASQWRAEHAAARAAWTRAVRECAPARRQSYKGLRDRFDAARAASRLETIVSACERPLGHPRYVAREVVAQIMRVLGSRCDRAIRAAVADCACERRDREDSRSYRAGEKIAAESKISCACGRAEDRLYRAAMRAIAKARPERVSDSSGTSAYRAHVTRLLARGVGLTVEDIESDMPAARAPEISGCVAPAYKRPLACQLEHARRPSSMLGETPEESRPESSDAFDAVLENLGFSRRTLAEDSGLHAAASRAGKARVNGKRGAEGLIQGYHTGFATQETPRRTLAAICAVKRIAPPTIPPALTTERKAARVALASKAWHAEPVQRPCQCVGCVADWRQESEAIDSRACSARRAQARYDMAVESVEAWYRRAISDARATDPAPVPIDVAESAIRAPGQGRKTPEGERTYILYAGGASFSAHASDTGDALRALLLLAGKRANGSGLSDEFADGRLTLSTRAPGARSLETVKICDVGTVLRSIAHAARRTTDAQVVAGMVARAVIAASEERCEESEWCPPDPRIVALERARDSIRGMLHTLARGRMTEERAWDTRPAPVDSAILARRSGMIDRIIRDAADKRTVAAARHEAVWCAAQNARAAEAARTGK